MRLSLNTSLTLAGAQAIQSAKRRLKFDPTPSNRIELPSGSKTLSASGSILDSAPASLSSDLALAIAFQQEPRSFNLKSSSNRGDLIKLFSKENDEELRAIRTEGIGDRSIGVTNTTPVEATKLVPLSVTDAYAVKVNQTQVSHDVSTPQEGASNIRKAVLQLASAYIRSNSTATSDDIQSAVDEHLGAGTAELFRLRIQDLGGGDSAIVADQVEYNNLNVEDQSIFDSAYAAVSLLYKPSDLNHSLKGTDISDSLNDLSSLLGMNGAPLVAELRNALNEISDVSSTLDSFYQKALDLGLSDSDLEGLQGIVDQLKNLDSNLTSSFDSNVLVDDFSSKYVSHRYGNAWSADQIEEKAALTANAEFLLK